MAKLTIKQENFCLVWLETGNATEAYRRAYSAGKMNPESINIAAFRLTENPKIKLRMEELRRPVIEKAQITLESHLADLKTLRNAALKAEQYGAAINAEIARGKAAGVHVEKRETKHTGSIEAPELVLVLNGVADKV